MIRQSSFFLVGVCLMFFSLGSVIGCPSGYYGVDCKTPCISICELCQVNHINDTDVLDCARGSCHPVTGQYYEKECNAFNGEYGDTCVGQISSLDKTCWKCQKGHCVNDCHCRFCIDVRQCWSISTGPLDCSKWCYTTSETGCFTPPNMYLIVGAIVGGIILLCCGWWYCKRECRSYNIEQDAEARARGTVKGLSYQSLA